MQAKGMRRVPLAGGKVHVFSDAKKIVIQVRASGPDDNPLVTWAKAAAALSPTDAIQLASELFTAALQHEQIVKKKAGNTTASQPGKPKPDPKSATAAAPKPAPSPTAASKEPSKLTTPS
jgi:hypothetical protein